jgi:hypothetical protein
VLVCKEPTRSVLAVKEERLIVFARILCVDKTKVCKLDVVRDPELIERILAELACTVFARTWFVLSVLVLTFIAERRDTLI